MREYLGELSMKHYMHLNEKPFLKIRKGSKTIELRLYDEKRKKLQVGDYIEFENISNPEQHILAEIVSLHVFDSFENLYKELPLDRCGYARNEMKTASASDMNLYYSLEEQSKYGVVGIEFKVVEKHDSGIIAVSRFLSFVLRHKPDAVGITLDSNGWARCDELIEGVSKTHPITWDLLEKIVETDDKQRYSFNIDKTLIRANQGHSIDVDVELEKVVPPQYLWHGTAEKYVESIEESGLIPKTRLYVHLSSDFATAQKVGARHGRVVVYRIDASKMHEHGFEFFKSANNVWLVKFVPAMYLCRDNREE